MAELWFDDLALGDAWTSTGRTMTEADVVAFCGVSGDFHPLHTDAEHAARSPFGTRLVHGALVLSVATGQRGQLPFVGQPLVAFLEVRRWTMRAPVLIGDTVRTRTTVAELRPTRDGRRGVVVQEVEVLNQRDEVVHAGEMVNLLQCRPGC
ncbi:MaoC/PaaZ C-terminal domain-containing protein [Nocardioides sp. J54]|uniref:MaoC/PaaZ C-terminal domain-containing protein n=1 Tax=Nocardioides sp. J54 TaxID=935866 RepID=UPI00049035D0|nr:MaoC/PaaZ C-terminal domain-containing protein [Nocardioides sp. J54]